MFKPLIPLLLLFSAHLGATTFDLELEGGPDVPIHAFGEAGGTRLLWLPGEHGLEGEAELGLAEHTAAGGLQVWVADLHTAYFVTPGRRSLFKMPPEEVAELIAAALPEQGKLFLLSYGRGAALTLLALHELQQQGRLDGRFGGVVLLHPNLLARSPRPGQANEYLPVVAASNLPIYILQPKNSSQRWYLPELVAQLQVGGSEVVVQLLNDVSEGYHVRPDSSEAELAMRAHTPRLVRRALKMLAPYHPQARVAVPMPESFEWSVESFSGLQRYEGDPTPPALQLKDLDGVERSLADYRGKVVLLNFWATWCPPCVEELPSLTRLRQRMAGKAFEVVTVDVGEEAALVRAFLDEHQAPLPTLLDADGSSFTRWQLRAVPSNFLLDAGGHIRYSYFGALEWDGEAVTAVIDGLLDESEREQQGRR